ncbi:hypothetical protein [Paraburkholderia sp. ZP32-5]|uniref:hypothetical protein n=1 Tax=Paraburkholderia sp. ZP32-5 TaxID=2883245 RepID=UPI001F309478|nr:hypothetical protein [Paraburkholderia sp. ZP32-5]
MGILSRWLTRRSTPDEGDAAQIHALVERVVALSPQLRLARDYESRLTAAVRQASSYVHRLVDDVPPAREASAAAWASDPYIHAFFAAPDDVCAALSRSHALRACFDEHPLADELFAVLGMAIDERQVFGVAQHGDAARTDVAQTTVSFSDHQVRVCGLSEQALRDEIVLRIIDQLVLEGLGKIEADARRYESLEHERAVLKTRLQILERQGAGVRSLVGSDAASNYAEVARLRAQIDESDQALAQLPLKTDALERHLEVICGVLGAPDSYFYVLKKTYLLDAMNVVVKHGESRPAQEIELRMAHLPANVTGMRAFSPVRFRRGNLLPATDVHTRARGLVI